MTEVSWEAVDGWIAERLIGEDPSVAAALEANRAAGLPAIDVSPLQGKWLNLLARIAGARRVLEVGTLGGYSTIWLARAVPRDGRVVTLEIDPDTAAVARQNIDRAGLGGRVEVKVGPALAALERMAAAGEAPFDLVFLDADKENNAAYLRLALKLSRPGTVIVCDNVVREGRIVDPGAADRATEGTRAFFAALAAEAGLSATALQTVGAKGWDGFAIALVETSLAGGA